MIPVSRVMARKFNPDEVTFTLTVRDADIEPDFEPEVNDFINKARETGDVWAWADVKITAKWAGFEGDAWIGGCCYKDEDDFKQNSGYYEQKLEEALNECLDTVGQQGWELETVTENDVKRAVVREMAPTYEAQLQRKDIPKERLLEAHTKTWAAYGDHTDTLHIAMELQDAGYYPAPEKTSDENMEWLANNLPNEPLAAMLEEAGLVAIWGLGWFRPEDVDPAKHKTHEQGMAEA